VNNQAALKTSRLPRSRRDRDQVSGYVHHCPFGFPGIFMVTVRSRLRPFLSRTDGGSSVRRLHALIVIEQAPVAPVWQTSQRTRTARGQHKRWT